MVKESEENPFDKLERLSMDRARRQENIRSLTHDVEVLEKQLLEKRKDLQENTNIKVAIENKITELFPIVR